jgi:hypothetical protein
MPGETTSRDVARRLIDKSQPKHPEKRGTDATRASVQAACENVFIDLARWFGVGGSRALFVRGIAKARPDHPALGAFRIGDDTDQVFGDLSSLAATHGDAAIADALEAVLVATLDLLGRLVGDDMVPRLLEESPTNTTPQDET